MPQAKVSGVLLIEHLFKTLGMSTIQHELTLICCLVRKNTLNVLTLHLPSNPLSKSNLVHICFPAVNTQVVNNHYIILKLYIGC